MCRSGFVPNHSSFHLRTHTLTSVAATLAVTSVQKRGAYSDKLCLSAFHCRADSQSEVWMSEKTTQFNSKLLMDLHGQHGPERRMHLQLQIYLKAQCVTYSRIHWHEMEYKIHMYINCVFIC